MLFQLFIAIFLGICVYIWFFKRKRETVYPVELLKNVSWNFCEGDYKDEASFIRAVKEYGTDAVNRNWQPDEIVLSGRDVIIVFSGSVKDENDQVEQGDFEFLLTADGYSFPASELLFKIHTRLLPYLDGAEICSFQGLTFYEKDKGNIPVYLLKME